MNSNRLLRGLGLGIVIASHVLICGDGRAETLRCREHFKISKDVCEIPPASGCVGGSNASPCVCIPGYVDTGCRWDPSRHPDPPPCNYDHQTICEDEADECDEEDEPWCREEDTGDDDDDDCADHVGRKSVLLSTGEVRYSPTQPDVQLVGDGLLSVLERGYSSAIIFRRGEERSDVVIPPHRSFGYGWWHPYEMYVDDDVKLAQGVYTRWVKANGTVQEFDNDEGVIDKRSHTLQFSIQNPAVSLLVGDFGGLKIIDADGTFYSFDREYVQGTLRYTTHNRLACTWRPGGNGLVRLWYYQDDDHPLEQRPCNAPTGNYQHLFCQDPTGALHGKLCLVEDVDNHQYVYFKSYNATQNLTELRYGHAAGSFSSAADVGAQMDALTYSNAYFYDSSADRYGVIPSSNPPAYEQKTGFTDVRLTRVEYRRRDPSSGNDVIYNSEHYTYTNTSYQRDDLNSATCLGIDYTAPSEYILLDHGDGAGNWQNVSTSLLESVRDHGGVSTGVAQSGSFVVGHAYTPEGWGALNAEAGNHYVLAYECVDDNCATSDEDGDGKLDRRVIVYNETTDDLVEYLVEEATAGQGYRISTASNGAVNNCGLSSEIFTYHPNGRIRFTVEANGIQRLHEYDSSKRLIRKTFYWPPGMGSPSSHDLESVLWSAPLGRSRVEEYSYGSAERPGTSTTISKGFSVLWPGSSAVANRLQNLGLGFTCANCAQAPGVTRDYDSFSGVLNSSTETGNTLIDASGAVAGHVSRVTEYDYDTSHRLTVTTDPLNRAVRTTYYGPSGTDVCGSASGLLLEGRVEKIEHCPDYSSGSCGNWILLEQRGGYDERGQMGCRIDESNTLSTFAYDTAGRVTDTAFYVQGVCSSTSGTSCFFDSQCPVTETCDMSSALLRGTTTKYSENGLVEHIYRFGADGSSLASVNTYPTTDPGTLCQGLDGTGNGNCFAALGELNRVKTVQSGTGDPGVGASFAPHSTQELTYDNHGNVSQTVLKDSASTVRRMSGARYDDEGNLIRRLIYEGTGGTASLAHAQHLFVNAMGRVTGIADPNFVANPDPGQDRLASEVNRTMTYDALSRLITSTQHEPGGANPLVTTYDYDIHGNLISVVDPDGRMTEYIYDDFAQLAVVNSPDSGVTRYQYDLAGNLTKRVEANGRTTTFTYDSRNRLTSEAHAQTGLTTVTVTHHYGSSTTDLAGSGLASQNCPGGNHFDPAGHTGRLAYTLHEAGGTYYSYSPLGEIVAVFEQKLGETDPCNFLKTAYAYDGVGRLTTITYPSRRTVEYDYIHVTTEGTDHLVYPWSVTVKDGSGTTLLSLTDMVYDVDGQLMGYTSGSTSFAADWNAAGEATSRQYGYNAANNLLDWDVSSRDGNGNILSAVDAQTSSPKTLDVEYDAYDRVTSAVGTNLRGYQNCEYVYDGAGNRAWEDCAYEGVGGRGGADGKPIVYNYADPMTQNLLDSISWDDGGATTCGGGDVSAIYTPDTLGRATKAYLRKFPTSDDLSALAYGAHGRLKSVSAPSGNYTYSYDARNLRKLKDGPSTDTWFVHNLSGSLLAEDTGTTGKDYIWVQGQLVAQVDGATNGTGGTAFIIGTDHLGTPMRAWNTSGTPVWAADYEAFGAATEYVPPGGSGDTTVSIRFPGQYKDEETGLHYNWWRYYDPNTGRYLTEDPIVSTVATKAPEIMSSLMEVWAADPGSLESFAYARNQPLRWIDPRGLKCVKGSERIVDTKIGDPGSKVVGCTSEFEGATCLCLCNVTGYDVTNVKERKWKDDGECPKCKKVGKTASRSSKTEFNGTSISKPFACGCLSGRLARR